MLHPPGLELLNPPSRPVFPQRRGLINARLTGTAVEIDARWAKTSHTGVFSCL